MATHLLLPRGHPPAQYAKAGIQGYAVCGPPVPIGDVAAETPENTTCDACLSKVSHEVELALGAEEVWHLTFQPFVDRYTRALCGFQRACGREGRVTTNLKDVTCPTCRVIGEADR